MPVFTPTPTPGLGRAVRAARESQRATRKPNLLVRWVRRIAIALAGIFALTGISGGTAQAWFWDTGDNLVSSLVYVCDPMNVPTVGDHTGIDTSLGLNNVPNSTHRETVVPKWHNDELSGNEGLAVDRLQAIYSPAEGGAANPDVVHPTYERYGFATLNWGSYGAGCFSPGYWFNGINNLALEYFVKIPMIASMVALKLSMDNMLYDIFSALINPVVNLFTTLFLPWGYFVAMIGILWAFIRRRGSLQETLKVVIFAIVILGTMLWMGNNTSPLVSKANNFVTAFAGQASCQIMNLQSGTKCDPKNPLGEINQSLWYGVVYNTWLEGQVGPKQAQADRGLEHENKVGVGPALLNGRYAAADADGVNVQRVRTAWNNFSYNPNSEGGQRKTEAWVNKPDATWNASPWLAAVKALCNDTATGKADKNDFKPNAPYQRWLYSGNCDAAGAGAGYPVASLTGYVYNEQLTTAFTGGIGAFAVGLATAFAAVYLALMKGMFYFLLLIGPLFLTISLFGDQKRRAFATKYFELLIANLIKQCAAVCAVLFVAYAMSSLMSPLPGSTIPDIPWALKPVLALFFFVAMALFAIPMAKAISAGVKGDTSAVTKMANAPADVAKAGTKVAVKAGLAAATGGTSAFASAAGGSKGLAAMSQMGRMLGHDSTAGKMLMGAGKMGKLKETLTDARAQKKGIDKAVDAGVNMLAKSDPKGEKYARDDDGNLTKKGRAAATKDLEKMVKSGRAGNIADSAQNSVMKGIFDGHRQQNDGEFHPDDPRNPAAKKASADTAARAENAVSKGAVGTESHGLKGQGAISGSSEALSESNPAAAGREVFAAKAREHVDGPSYMRNSDLTPKVVSSPKEVLASAELTKDQVVKDPSTLLEGAAYDGGNTAKMDPTHPATAHMSDLRFALAAGDSEGVRKSADAASHAIEANGVPAMVSQTVSTGDTAKNFEPINVLGAMPSVSADTSWQDRAESARVMQAATATLPEGHSAAPAVSAYTEALSNPAVNADHLGALKLDAVRELDASRVSPDQPALIEVPASAYADTAPQRVQAMAPAAETPVESQQALSAANPDQGRLFGGATRVSSESAQPAPSGGSPAPSVSSAPAAATPQQARPAAPEPQEPLFEAFGSQAEPQHPAPQPAPAPQPMSAPREEGPRYEPPRAEAPRPEQPSLFGSSPVEASPVREQTPAPQQSAPAQPAPERWSAPAEGPAPRAEVAAQSPLFGGDEPPRRRDEGKVEQGNAEPRRSLFGRQDSLFSASPKEGGAEQSVTPDSPDEPDESAVVGREEAEDDQIPQHKRTQRRWTSGLFSSNDDEE